VQVGIGHPGHPSPFIPLHALFELVEASSVELVLLVPKRLDLFLLAQVGAECLAISDLL